MHVMESGPDVSLLSIWRAELRRFAGRWYPQSHVRYDLVGDVSEDGERERMQLVMIVKRFSRCIANVLASHWEGQRTKSNMAELFVVDVAKYLGIRFLV